MATSKTEIANMAFVFLGAKRINAFTDDSKEARIASTTYDHIRDQVLRDHPWNFAIKRATISADATAPEWEFDASYQLPGDCLRVLKVNGQDPETNRWRVEGSRKIFTDLGTPIEIQYVFREVAVGNYDTSFVVALAYALATHWAEPITKTATLKAEMLDSYRIQLSGARTSDGQESTVVQLDSCDWINVRY
jgi:hypothetical protein